MEIFLVKVIFVTVLIYVSYIALLIINKLSKKKIKADLYAAVNGVLYFGLVFNLIHMANVLLSENTNNIKITIIAITPLTIILILAFRYFKTKRII